MPFGCWIKRFARRAPLPWSVHPSLACDGGLHGLILGEPQCQNLAKHFDLYKLIGLRTSTKKPAFSSPDCSA